MRALWWIAALLVLIGLAPMLGLLAASAVAALGGCPLHEGFAQPCVIAGVDWGQALYTAGVGGWLFFLTAPVALAGFALAACLALVSLWRWSQR